MHGLVIIEGMTLSGHPWIINEIICNFLVRTLQYLKKIFLPMTSELFVSENAECNKPKML